LGCAGAPAPTYDPLAAIVKGCDKKLGLFHYRPVFITSIDGKGPYSDYGRGIPVKPGTHRIGITTALSFGTSAHGEFDLDFKGGGTYRLEMTPVAKAPDADAEAYDLQIFEETLQGDRMVVDLPVMFSVDPNPTTQQVTSTQIIRSDRARFD
jgi:hypothetical protein